MKLETISVRSTIFSQIGKTGQREFPQPRLEPTVSDRVFTTVYSPIDIPRAPGKRDASHLTVL